MIHWGRSRDEFWRLHPREFWWCMEAKKDEIESKKAKSGKITEEEAREMADELRHYRVQKGFPAE